MTHFVCDSLISKILDSYHQLGGINYIGKENLPSKDRIQFITVKLKEILFPGFFEESSNLHQETVKKLLQEKLEELSRLLTDAITKSLCWQRQGQLHNHTSCVDKADMIVTAFLKHIPELREWLLDDVNAIFQGDPAAKNIPEVILAYPGFQAVVLYRIAHFFHKQDVPLIPRLISEIVHASTGVDIHPGAKIGRRFCIDHGTGIVIGETAELGNDVKLYQGVTIGALSVSKDLAQKKRHPTIEDNVTIYARTTILGGKTVIGRNSIIGGNLWITESIPADSKLYMESRSQFKIKSK